MKLRWRFDRRIPVALVFSIVLQLASGLIWATQLYARVGQLEESHVDDAALNEKFARLEERLDFMKQNIVSVRGQLDRLTDKLIGGK